MKAQLADALVENILHPLVDLQVLGRVVVVVLGSEGGLKLMGVREGGLGVESSGVAGEGEGLREVLGLAHGVGCLVLLQARVGDVGLDRLSFVSLAFVPELPHEASFRLDAWR